eukprot:359159-Chlamydomonas_euryale.AAC.9
MDGWMDGWMDVCVCVCVIIPHHAFLASLGVASSALGADCFASGASSCKVDSSSPTGASSEALPYPLPYAACGGGRECGVAELASTSRGNVVCMLCWINLICVRCGFIPCACHVRPLCMRD